MSSKLMADISAGKIAYQAYTIQHGIESLAIKVPLQESLAFERDFQDWQKAGKSSKAQLLKLITKHGGSLRSQA